MVCYGRRVHDFASPPAIEPDLLMLAYRSGIFPMADHRNDPEIFWVEPRQRGILPLDSFHLSKSLARTLRRGRFAVTCNAAFAQVVQACAAPRSGDNGESWISQRIAASFQRLHELGQAHSIECWEARGDGGPVLAGGLYGVGFDRVFCGESMFSRARDASKVAVAWLVAALRRASAELLDCQFITPHLASLGAIEVSQRRYLALLRTAQRPYAAPEIGDALAAAAGDDVPPGLPEGFAALLGDALAADPSSSPGNFIAQFLIQPS
jgi:leucyl/phenylalanyl-tRNA--protein transferase